MERGNLSAGGRPKQHKQGRDAEICPRYGEADGQKGAKESGGKCSRGAKGGFSRQREGSIRKGVSAGQQT